MSRLMHTKACASLPCKFCLRKGWRMVGHN